MSSAYNLKIEVARSTINSITVEVYAERGVHGVIRDVVRRKEEGGGVES
jgi:hypothetical protein